MRISLPILATYWSLPLWCNLGLSHQEEESLDLHFQLWHFFQHLINITNTYSEHWSKICFHNVTLVALPFAPSPTSVFVFFLSLLDAAGMRLTLQFQESKSELSINTAHFCFMWELSHIMTNSPPLLQPSSIIFSPSDWANSELLCNSFRPRFNMPALLVFVHSDPLLLRPDAFV